MKNIPLLVVVLLLLITALASAQKSDRLEITYKHSTLYFSNRPGHPGGKLIPLVESKVSSRTGEQFGIYRGSVGSNAPVLEILDPANRVLKSVSAAELEAGLVKEKSTSSARRVENVYTFQLPETKVELTVKALVSGEAGGGDSRQQMIISFGLKATRPLRAALRLSLPIIGNAEVADRGVIISAKSDPGALAAAIFPSSRTVNIVNNRADITSPVLAADDLNETPFLWFVVNGVTGTSRTDARVQARQALQGISSSAEEPRLVVVVSANKERALPGDTVSYTVICANVGNGDATNVVLSNPIPAGTTYIDGTAIAGGMAVSFDRGDGGQSGDVRVITWTPPRALKPGEERIVGFKVVTR